ncbi:hypothetical protein LINGRAHAP2_LOCUS33196 [Linum grandiflorum]
MSLSAAIDFSIKHSAMEFPYLSDESVKPFLFTSFAESLTSIHLEMDRILHPDGTVLMYDKVDLVKQGNG